MEVTIHIKQLKRDGYQELFLANEAILTNKDTVKGLQPLLDRGRFATTTSMICLL